MFPWILVLLLLLCLQTLLYLLYWKARRNFKKIPSYPQLPFLGTMHWFIGGGQVIFQRLIEISKIMDETNLPFVVWLGPRPLLLLSNPEDVKTVTNAYLEKPYFYKFGRDWLGDGLVTAPGEIWKKNIKMIAGTFTKTMVDGFQDIFNTKAMELVINLKEKANKTPFDAMPHLSYITLGTICQTGLGVTYSSGNKEMEDYYKAFVNALELMIKRGLNLFYHCDRLYRLSNDRKRFLKSIAVMHNVSDTVIKKKIRERKNKKHVDIHNIDEDCSKPTFKTVLDVLLDMSEVDPNMTEDQVRAEVHTIIVGGQETVATSLCYALLMLGCNPRVQDKLYKEVKDVIGNKIKIDKDDLSRLVYCEAVILEALRLFPPIPVVTRHADRDLQIQSCTIPKGTLCSLNLYGAGRSQRAWGSDADQYIPERWLPPRTPSTAAFMPFSTGRRACIGKRYALAITKTLLAHSVKNLEFISEAGNLEFALDVGLRAVKGNLMQVKIRDQYKEVEIDLDSTTQIFL